MKNANPVSWCRALGLVIILLPVFLAGCGKEEAKKAPAAIKSAAEFFPIKVGDRTVRMQLAVHPAELTYGLMGRRDLQPDQGMIFVFRRGERRGFYMRNTPTPLDIGYFGSDGILEEVYPMYPFDEKTVPSRSNAIQFALEMNQGWYRANNVQPGARLDLKAVTAALKARGFEPAVFGLK